jgi:ABC-type Fe3+/spermidine/putrescine transport system ATPase subunit
MDLGEGERILAVDPGGDEDTRTITVRPEWIKLAPGEAGARERSSHVSGTIADVVYLGSVTQLIIALRTGERVSVHRLNDEVTAVDPRPSDRVTLHWAAEHSYVIGGATGNIEAQAGDTPAPANDEEERHGQAVRG